MGFLPRSDSSHVERIGQVVMSRPSPDGTAVLTCSICSKVSAMFGHQEPVSLLFFGNILESTLSCMESAGFWNVATQPVRTLDIRR